MTRAGSGQFGAATRVAAGVAARSGGGLVSGQAAGRQGFFVLCWLVKENRPRADTTQERGKGQNGNVGSTGYQSKRELKSC